MFPALEDLDLFGGVRHVGAKRVGPTLPFGSQLSSSLAQR